MGLIDLSHHGGVRGTLSADLRSSGAVTAATVPPSALEPLRPNGGITDADR
ncbi:MULTISPECIES: hypothetical protein [Kitasatospora]|uniref:Uncharacterized protein n=1 Tax=Kitasatospora cystarginea TaxID=58350 RepID=A0ABN3DMP7_9ACTN